MVSVRHRVLTGKTLSSLLRRHLPMHALQLLYTDRRYYVAFVCFRYPAGPTYFPPSIATMRFILFTGAVLPDVRLTSFCLIPPCNASTVLHLLLLRSRPQLQQRLVRDDMEASCVHVN